MPMVQLKKLSWQHKNLKPLYYTAGVMRMALPGALLRRRLPAKLAALMDHERQDVLGRLDYYNKLTPGRALPGAPPLAELRFDSAHKTYFFDSYQYARYFDPRLRANFTFGDVTWIPEQPSFVKSRPIAGDNANSVLLKLNKVRHFIYTKDRRPFETKKDLLVGRGRFKNPRRTHFAQMYWDHPLCDVGQPSRKGHDQWIKPRLTIHQHLGYKFILCLEGNDVASNLKWVMSSNSLAVMPRPTFETWFMEGTLVPDYHYVLIKDDFSDLEERLRYYMQHTDEAQQISHQAQQYVRQFRNNPREDLISLMVMQKYFICTGQLTAG